MNGLIIALLLAAPPSLPYPAAAIPAAQSTPMPQAWDKLFVVVYRPGPQWVQGVPMSGQNLRPHGTYIAGLLRSGRLFAGGGFVGRDGGIAILRAADLAEANALIEADPAVSSGLFLAQVHEWAPRFHSRQPLVETAR